MAKTVTDTLIAKIDADISRLRDMREYLLSATDADPAPAAPKTRKPRKKKGLPADTTAETTGF
jgi:hypothetical protein